MDNLRVIHQESRANRMLPATLGEKVAAVRAERGWTLEELANRAEVAVKTVWAIEHGRHRPRRATLNVLAAALRIDPDSLQARGDVRPTRPPDEARRRDREGRSQ